MAGMTVTALKTKIEAFQVPAGSDIDPGDLRKALLNTMLDQLQNIPSGKAFTLTVNLKGNSSDSFSFSLSHQEAVLEAATHVINQVMEDISKNKFDSIAEIETTLNVNLSTTLTTLEQAATKIDKRQNEHPKGYQPLYTYSKPSYAGISQAQQEKVAVAAVAGAIAIYIGSLLLAPPFTPLGFLFIIVGSALLLPTALTVVKETVFALSNAALFFANLLITAYYLGDNLKDTNLMPAVEKLINPQPPKAMMDYFKSALPKESKNATIPGLDKSSMMNDKHN